MPRAALLPVRGWPGVAPRTAKTRARHVGVFRAAAFKCIAPQPRNALKTALGHVKMRYVQKALLRQNESKIR